MAHVVKRSDLEDALAALSEACPDPVSGPWGPTSLAWRVAREKAVLLGGGAAALLQLAHPFVGHAVSSSASAVDDPLRRFKRTFEKVYAMVFGPLDEVIEASRRVHNVHVGVTGTLPHAVGRFAAGHHYEANQVDGLMWVLTTLVDGSVTAYGKAFGPLSVRDREAYWQDVRTLGTLLGLMELPPTWRAFAAYRDAMLASDTLAVSPAAAVVGRRLLAGPDLATAPLWATYRAVTAALLPPRFHEPFGLRYGLRERALAHAAFAAVRVAAPRLPERVRCTPAYIEAGWRLRGRGPRRDRVGRRLEEVALQILLRPTN